MNKKNKIFSLPSGNRGIGAIGELMRRGAKAKVGVVLLFMALTVNAGDLTRYCNPLLGTATLWTPEDLGYTRTEVKRAWGAETFPGASVPNAMVQCTPVTMYHSGSGYQYEDHQIYGFAHSSKGHWDQLHLPSGDFGANSFNKSVLNSGSPPVRTTE